MTLLAAGGGTAYWYATRATGIVALLLLTAVVLLGVASALRLHSRRWPLFALVGAHRNLTLLAIGFVTLHVVTTIADGYAPVGLKDAVVPFASSYRPIWLGLGAVAFDLLLALVVTSLFRARVGARLWRSLHWLAYAAWPVALVHALGTGSDARYGWLSTIAFGCLALIALLSLWRARGGHPGLRAAAVATAVLVPLAIGWWYRQGPARHGWAARAGTPAPLLGAVVKQRAPGGVAARSSAVSATVVEPAGFTASLRGTVRQLAAAQGEVLVRLVFRLLGHPGGAARIDLRGIPDGGGVSMTASGVSFVPATTRTVYTGAVTGLNGSLVSADVVDTAGDRLHLLFRLRIDAGAGNVSGSLRGVRGGGTG